jgi:multiple sugar transport system ATP-binding protein
MSETTTTDPETVADEETQVDQTGNLELREVRKTFNDGEIVAVKSFDVALNPGEFLVLVGPSGCGKTTTLRMIAGLEEPDSGKIIIDGEDVAGKEARERDIAMVFQSYALYPHMTVRQNMAYPMKVRGRGKTERNERVEETAELLQITELLDRKPKDLSGGQQQRVALGRALVREPKVFLLDEPLSNLDQKLRVQMRTELNKLQNTIGRTAVYVTHDQAEAMTLGDRIVVMDHGEIQQVAPPQTIYHRPTNQFVAGFIGEPEMNFFDATVDVSDRSIETDNFTLSMTDQMVDALEARGVSRGQVTFGIRPEHISLESNSLRLDGHEGNTATAEAIVVENMGDDKHLTISGDGKEYQAIVDGDTDVTRNDTHSYVFDLERAHLFDSETGNNLLYDE